MKSTLIDSHGRLIYSVVQITTYSGDIIFSLIVTGVLLHAASDMVMSNNVINDGVIITPLYL